MIQQRLELTDEEALRLGEVMEGFLESRQQLQREEQALRQRVSAVLLEGGPSGEEAAGLLDRLLELREREMSLFRSEQEALRDLLTPYQVLQFHALREQLNERVRALGQQPGMRRRGGPPGPRAEGGPGGVPLEGPMADLPAQGG
jgi:Spy/CpxP family protein refolding chaperone